MTYRATPVVLAGSDLGDLRHVCAFFPSDNEEYDVLLPFIKTGLAHGEKAIHAIDLELRGAADTCCIMRTHPVVIIGGLAQRNPFHVPPERFIQLLRARRAENGATA
jgi:hypothetical protein